MKAIPISDDLNRMCVRLDYEARRKADNIAFLLLKDGYYESDDFYDRLEDLRKICAIIEDVLQEIMNSLNAFSIKGEIDQFGNLVFLAYVNTGGD